jgi:hypothetical protein
MKRIVFLGFVGLGFLPFAARLAAGDEDAVDHRFRFFAGFQGDVVTGGNTSRFKVDTEMRYAWRVAKNARIMLLDLVTLKALENGKVIMESSMSRDRFFYGNASGTQDFNEKNAPEALKQLLQDSFGSPLYKLTTDKNGGETSRKMIAGPGAKLVTSSGVIANGLLFHPPFPADKDQWDADTELSMGNAGFTKGKLTYKKTTAAGRQQSVSVSGNLSKEIVQEPGTQVAVKNLTLAVEGEQTYDTRLREWVSGKLKINVSFETWKGDEKTGSTTGTMALRFERIEKK